MLQHVRISIFHGWGASHMQATSIPPFLDPRLPLYINSSVLASTCIASALWPSWITRSWLESSNPFRHRPRSGLLNHAASGLLLLINTYFFFSSHIYMYVSVWVYVHRVPAGAWGGQRASDPLELVPQAVASHQRRVLGTEPWTFGRAANALIRWAMSPAPKIYFLWDNL